MLRTEYTRRGATPAQISKYLRLHPGTREPILRRPDGRPLFMAWFEENQNSTEDFIRISVMYFNAQHYAEAGPSYTPQLGAVIDAIRLSNDTKLLVDDGLLWFIENRAPGHAEQFSNWLSMWLERATDDRAPLAHEETTHERNQRWHSLNNGNPPIRQKQIAEQEQVSPATVRSGIHAINRELKKNDSRGGVKKGG